MRVRCLRIDRFRAIEHLQFKPGPRTVILGPNNSGKSTILEALDLLLHHGLGRPRPAPSEVDYYGRNPHAGFEIEAVIGELDGDFRAEIRHHLEGWHEQQGEVIAEPDGDGIEAVVRVRVRASADLDLMHEFAKPESEGARFHPRLRAKVGWVFDGRARDPTQQLGFYQGGLLDRLFGEVNLDPAVDELRQSLGGGAAAVNEDQAVAGVLRGLGDDLRRLGLLGAEESPLFEVGGVSKRELLQALRLALPGTEAIIPLWRQGRGIQRLLLVSVLLRLAGAADRVPIAGLEEPEEALEPLRQAQLSRMLRSIAERGGQVFVVTHSTEIARAFEIDDFLLLRERSAGAGFRHLRGVLTPAVIQAYERRLDGAVVRGLFARIPVLVEGPSDRGIFEVFWAALARAGRVASAHEVGLDVVNAEGTTSLPMLADVLDEAGKSVVVWAEQDTPEVRDIVERLRQEGHCSGILLYEPPPGRTNLEGALAYGSSLAALVGALRTLADDRGYGWEEQRADLVSRCEGVEPAQREAAKATASLEELFAALGEEHARAVIKLALGSRSVSPFEMKGARQARTVAAAIVEAEGVPEPFSSGLTRLDRWIRAGCARDSDIPMAGA